MKYKEDYWMIDTPQGREFALTYCEQCPQRYMVRQWDHKLQAWYPAPEGKIYWRPLDEPPVKEDVVDKWIAVKVKSGE